MDFFNQTVIVGATPVVIDLVSDVYAYINWNNSSTVSVSVKITSDAHGQGQTTFSANQNNSVDKVWLRRLILTGNGGVVAIIVSDDKVQPVVTPIVTISGAVSLSAGTAVSISGTAIVSVSGTPTVSLNAGSSVSISGTPTVSLNAGSTVSISGTATVSITGTPVVSLNSGSTVALSGTSTVSISGTPTVSLNAGSTVSLAAGTAAVGTVKTSPLGTKVNSGFLGPTALPESTGETVIVAGVGNVTAGSRLAYNLAVSPVISVAAATELIQYLALKGHTSGKYYAVCYAGQTANGEFDFTETAEAIDMVWKNSSAATGANAGGYWTASTP